MKYTLTIAVALLLAACASTPQRDAAVMSAGENARTFSDLVEFGTGFFGGPKAAGEGRLEIGSAGLIWTNDRDSGRKPRSPAGGHQPGVAHLRVAAE